ncbi:hypothetical protein RQP46_005054 [Phenoliferia psychrophenolica]
MTGMSSDPLVSTRISLAWPPALPSELTSTLVLTGRTGAFVDLRIFINGDHIGQIDWATAGLKTWLPDSTPETPKAMFTSHLDSRFVPSDSSSTDSPPEPDVGVFQSLPNGDVLETGSMPNPLSPTPLLPVPYEEVWRRLPLPPVATVRATFLRAGDTFIARVGDYQLGIAKGDKESGFLARRMERKKEVPVTLPRTREGGIELADYRPLSLDSGYAAGNGSDEDGELQVKLERRPAGGNEGILMKAGRGGGGADAAKRTSRICTRNSVLFLALILIQAIGVIAMIILVFITAIHALTPDLTDAGDEVRENPRFEAVTTYLAIFCLAECFEVYITLEALFQSNILQIGLMLPCQICMTVYSAFLPSQLAKALSMAAEASYAMPSEVDLTVVYHRVRIYAWVILGVIALVTLVMAGFVCLLYSDFGWALCLLKYDAFFWVSFTTQFLILVTHTPPVERYMTYVAIPVTLAALVLSAMALRYENRVGMYAFLGLQVAAVGYFGFKIYRMFANESESRYDITRATLLTFACASISLLIATFVVSIMCLRNFGIGLKGKSAS